MMKNRRVEMKTLEELLSRRWITVEKNKELFYKVHDEYLEYEDFLKDKLGFTKMGGFVDEVDGAECFWYELDKENF